MTKKVADRETVKGGSNGRKVAKSDLIAAARRYRTAAHAAEALGMNSAAFRRACNVNGVKWRNEKGWGEFTSRKYMDTCTTKDCSHRPASDSGLCFKCYAKTRTRSTAQ